MNGYEITCVNKSPGGQLVRIGGDGWSLPIHEAIVKMLSDQIRLFIRINEQEFEIGVRGNGTNAYLVLEPDATALHSIADLTSC